MEHGFRTSDHGAINRTIAAVKRDHDAKTAERKAKGLPFDQEPDEGKVRETAQRQQRDIVDIFMKRVFG